MRRRPVAASRASPPSRAWRTSPTPGRCTGSAPASSICSAAATPARGIDRARHRRHRRPGARPAELALFNTHAGGTCFKPIHIFEAGSGKPILSLLRPGKRPSGEGIARVLAHVIHRIRRRWPKVSILVRGDGHYCAPEVLDLLRQKRCDYILGLSRNKTLDALAAPWREQCRWHWKPGPKVRRFHRFQYAAKSSSHPEKVIARVEATDLGTDARFIVTSLTGRGKHLYEKVYCARGCMENLIKDMKLSTRSDKTACSRWQANQFRLFLHMGAYWLLHSVRMAAPEIALARRDLRHHPQRLRQDRRARRGAEALDQARVPAPSAARRCAGARLVRLPGSIFRLPLSWLSDGSARDWIGEQRQHRRSDMPYIG